MMKRDTLELYLKGVQDYEVKQWISANNRKRAF